MSLDFQIQRAKQIVALKSDAIRTYKPSDELIQLFRKKDRISTKNGDVEGRSFAFVKTSQESAIFAQRAASFQSMRSKAAEFEDGPWFVPFKWSALSTKELRLLFWLGSTEIVINGKKHGDICSMCSRAIKCEHEGIDHNPDFTCAVSKDLLVLED